MNVFERYAPFIQDYIFRSGWQSLRAVQNAAGDAIFNTDENVLLTASTASGKTEAAFFPILTLLEEDPSKTVGVLYIAPLKALINDQFGRLNELCEEEGIAVTRWHGDAAQSRKRKLLKKPSGILQITPESLESLMINKHGEIPSLFGDLRFIVIDEIHSLLRADRGLQTFCLIERLCKLAGCDPRRIGLSATIGNPELAGQFLAAGSGRGTIIPKFDGGKEVWRLSMEHFYNTAPQADEGRAPVQDAPPLEAPTDAAPKAADPGIGYIFEHTRGKKCLVFTNSREECESVCQSLRQYCEVNHEPDRFLIHHGNLSASYRESAEEEMKDADSLMSVSSSARSRSTRRSRSRASCSAWGAPGGGAIPRRCGSSCGRIIRRRAPCCRTASRGISFRGSRWCSSISRSASWSRRAWTGCLTACCITRP